MIPYKKKAIGLEHHHQSDGLLKQSAERRYRAPLCSLLNCTVSLRNPSGIHLTKNQKEVYVYVVFVLPILKGVGWAWGSAYWCWIGTCIFVKLTAQKPQFLGLRKNVGNLVRLSLWQVPITARGLYLPYSYSAMGCLIKSLSSKPESNSCLK